jgi:hypothetical protein
MNKFLSVSPDRYGRFGHQTTSISAGILLASITNSKLVSPRYMYFCDKWNKYSDYTRSKFVVPELKGESLKISYLEREIPDQHGNRKWDLTDNKHLWDLTRKILAAEDNSLIYLPFDQSAGNLLRLYNQVEIRNDIKNIFSFDLKTSMRCPYVCIHIRRGDCTPAAHPKWFVGDDFYLKLIQTIFQCIPAFYKVCVCTQGEISWLQQIADSKIVEPDRFIVRSTNQLFINDSEIEDFVLFKEADILFSASSSFSYWATILGSHRLVFDISRSGTHPLKNVKTVNPDININSSMTRIKNLINQCL